MKGYKLRKAAVAIAWGPEPNEIPHPGVNQISHPSGVIQLEGPFIPVKKDQKKEYDRIVELEVDGVKVQGAYPEFYLSQTTDGNFDEQDLREMNENTYHLLWIGLNFDYHGESPKEEGAELVDWDVFDFNDYYLENEKDREAVKKALSPIVTENKEAWEEEFRESWEHPDAGDFDGSPDEDYYYKYKMR